MVEYAKEPEGSKGDAKVSCLTLAESNHFGTPFPMASPVLVHQRKDFATFNYFVSTLVSFAKKLHKVQAFGTDLVIRS